MTTDPLPQEKRFVTSLLPWVAVAGGLAVYLVTLGRWITLNSLGPFAQVAGLQWQPVVNHPLYFLLTLPLKLLPVAWLPVALNLFSAICGALTLGLMARSVALLPHDRTHPQRVAEQSEGALLTIRAAWLPVVLAVLACGLQFTFWERATAGGPELLNLLLFAYVVRCLLEYRREGREGWLLQAVFVYALGMTGNWVLILLLPAFLASLIWFMGLSFFSARFIPRAWLVALAGLSFYLVLPMVALFHQDLSVGFWPGLKFMLAAQKNALRAFYDWARHQAPLQATALLLQSLLPMVIIGLNFKPNFGDTSRLGSGLAQWVFHLLHAALLVLCGWVALDPPFSASQLGSGAQFLPAQYLAALGLGYFSGYFLLLFGERAKARGRYRELQESFNRVVTLGVWLFALLLVAVLVYRNAPVIRAGNSPILREYAAALTSRLPAEPAVLLSDDPRRLWLVQAALAGDSKSPKHLGVDTHSLAWPEYHHVLHRQSAGAWPLAPSNQPPPMPPLLLVDRVLKQATQRPVFYLHPSFGYYFEFLRAEPHGVVQRLVPYSTNEIIAPLVSATVADENQKFWDDLAAGPLARLEPLLPSASAHASTNFMDRLLVRLHIARGAVQDARLVAGYLSRSLTQWGVQLQRMGRLEEAGQAFARAERLNPDNVVAQVNREFNANLVAGNKAAVTVTGNIEEKFGAYRGWDQVLLENGPFDEPSFCYEQGRVFWQQSLARQSLTEFERVRSLVPDDLNSRIWLASLYQSCRLPDRALEVVAELKSQPDRFALTSTNRTELLGLEASALFQRGQAAAAERLLQTAISRDASNYLLLAVSGQVYMHNGQPTNALVLFGKQLKLRPNDTHAMLNLASVSMQIGAYRDALPPLNRVLQVQTNNHEALLFRAIANLQSDNLDHAQQDYERLLELYPNYFKVLYGLGEVAWRRKDTNAAIRFFERYLSNAAPDTVESKSVAGRLGQLRPAAP